MDFPKTGIKRFDTLVASAATRGMPVTGGPSDMRVEIGHNSSHTWYAELISGVPFVVAFSDTSDDPHGHRIGSNEDVPTYVGHW